MTEDGRWRTEDGGWETEDGGVMTEDGDDGRHDEKIQTKHEGHKGHNVLRRGRSK